MKYEDLDQDTRDLIDFMVEKTGKTKEMAILAFVEMGMLSMIAAVCEDKREKIMQRIFDVVNKDEKLKQTAIAYSSTWEI